MDIGNLGSVYNDLYGSASSVKASQLKDQLENKVKSGYENATDEELMDVCKQFESYFLEQMFKEMMKTVPTNDSSSANGKLVDYFKDEMVRDVAAQSTESNSLGLAQMLYDRTASPEAVCLSNLFRFGNLRKR